MLVFINFVYCYYPVYFSKRKYPDLCKTKKASNSSVYSSETCFSILRIDNEMQERFKVFTSVTIVTTFYFAESLCGLVGRNQSFGKACCIHLQP
jgi:hypothetical protein